MIVGLSSESDHALVFSNFIFLEVVLSPSREIARLENNSLFLIQEPHSSEHFVVQTRIGLDLSYETALRFDEYVRQGALLAEVPCK